MLSVLLKAVAVGLVLYGGYIVYELTATEQLDYSVLEISESNIELRQYAPFIVAEIDVQADNAQQAANKGFRPLAGYIFGANRPNKQVKMTAPVTTRESPVSTRESPGSTRESGGETISMTAPVTAQSKEGEKISMTAPVTTMQSNDSATYTVQFSMPAKWTMETLPEPENSNVRLAPQPAQLRLAKTYRGEPSVEEITEAKAELQSHAESAGLAVVDKPVWAGYSSPAIPKPLRKWEVMLAVER